jgi:hypothetical protein
MEQTTLLWCSLDTAVIGGLAFLDTYRTMCLVPAPDIRRVLEEIRDMRPVA